MLNILKSLNDNIVSLSGKLKARGLVPKGDGKDNDEDRMEEGTITNIIQSHTDRSCEKDQELLVEEFQRINDAVETILDLKRRVGEHVKDT